MDKKDVIEFFDRHAPDWDAEMIRNDAVISTILDNANVRAGARVLDVACGTGVLVPDYLARGVASVTGIDISPEMIRIAAGKFPSDKVSFICGDVEEAALDGDYDCIVVYNAFPHFPQPQRLIDRLSGLLAPGGTLNGFKNTQQFVWMRDNAHRFGFILRYGDGMEYITGYKFEPWHYRYVGVDAATFIYENDLTFEEYYAYYVKK